MWSNKKIVNILMDVLLMLLGMNFMHYGQLALPLMCLILFIDHKAKLNIKSIKTFLILVAFSISFFIFSYRFAGFYATMGFCLPMAYYIGSNVKNDNEENLKRFIYLLSFAMALHMVLNLFYELASWGNDLSYWFSKSKHYDIWLNGPIKTTASALNSLFINAIAYYLIVIEKEKKYKYSGIVLFLLSSFYNLALGRRTTFFLLIISFGLSFLIDTLFIRKNTAIMKQIMIIVGLGLTVLAIVIGFNLFGVRDFLANVSLFKRIALVGLYSGRLEILFEGLKLFPNYLWGGQQISNIIDDCFHNFWADIYDYVGIIPFILMLAYSYVSTKNNIIKAFKMKSDLKIMLIVIDVCAFCIFNLEAIMTGASIILICIVMLNSLRDVIKIDE